MSVLEMPWGYNQSFGFSFALARGILNRTWIYACDNVHENSETFDVAEAALPQSPLL